MNIVFAASEMVPFSKTGGLADVVGTLAKEIQQLGHEVSAFIPKYKGLDARTLGFKTVIDRLDVPLGSETVPAKISLKTLESGVKVYLVDNTDFFNRDGYYGTIQGDYPDNDRRFTFFQRAILEALIALGIKPHILHCHDWQTGLLPVYLKTLYAGRGGLDKTKSVFTIHNLAYQGNFPPDSLPATGLDWKHFKIERLEFYGKVSFIKGGILDADRVTTVSERYAQEIQTPEFGSGLDGVLSKAKSRLVGIVNGIDPEEWDPSRDADIPVHFDLEHIQKKMENKKALQKENGFKSDPSVPLIGVISRLVDQKGLDILIPAMDSLFKLKYQFVLLGTGEEKYHNALRDIARKNRERCGIHILFDGKMAKRIYAGSDMILMPSYYEPCGLGQMIALRYGTIPVVRSTGGLADTITEFDPKTGKGNGFIFTDYKSDALVEALGRAQKTFEQPRVWATLVTNAMNCDFTWTASAKRYVEIYESTKRKPAMESGK